MHLTEVADQWPIDMNTRSKCRCPPKFFANSQIIYKKQIRWKLTKQIKSNNNATTVQSQDILIGMIDDELTWNILIEYLRLHGECNSRPARNPSSIPLLRRWHHHVHVHKNTCGRWWTICKLRTAWPRGIPHEASIRRPYRNVELRDRMKPGNRNGSFKIHCSARKSFIFLSKAQVF